MQPASACQKSLAEFAASAANKVNIIFGRGVYVDENTYQAANVQIVRQRRTVCAMQRTAKGWRKSPKGFFDSLTWRGHNPAR